MVQALDWGLCLECFMFDTGPEGPEIEGCQAGSELAETFSEVDFNVPLLAPALQLRPPTSNLQPPTSDIQPPCS